MVATPQEVGMIIAFAGVLCSALTLFAVYLLMRMIPPQQVLVPVYAGVQPIAPSRLRQLTDALPSQPVDRKVAALNNALRDGLQKVTAYADLAQIDTERGLEGVLRAVRETVAALENIAGSSG